MVKTAVIYARYSCDSQSEQSIEGQLHVCQEYAQKNGILILDTYIDRAMSGTNDNRPEFQRMLKDSGKKEWNYVLVYKLDRFSRSKYETAIHKKTLKDNGAKVVSAMENIPDTPEGIILESLLEGMNQYYSAELAQKVKRGMKETRRKGLYQGGGLPYGYKVVDRKIQVDEAAAQAVLFMFEQYSTGKFVSEIVDNLTAKGILFRGKPFRKNLIYNILKNEKYSGSYRHEEEIVDNMYPQIVPPELYDKVRAIVERNKCGRRSVKATYLLRLKLRCGYCGRPISAECGRGRDGNPNRYYKCLGRKKDNNGCNKKQVKKEELENLVVNAIVEEIGKPDVLDELVAELLKRQDEQLANNSTLSMLIKEKAKVDKMLENIVAAISNGIVSRTTNAKLQELEKQQEDLDRLIHIEQNKQSVRMTESEIRAFYQKALLLEPKMLISSLVKEIVLYDDRMDIYYNTPFKTSPDDSRGSSFYTGIWYMHKKKPRNPVLVKIQITVQMFIK